MPGSISIACRNKRLCLGKILLGALVSVPKAALVEVPGAQIVRPVRPRPLTLGLAKLGLDRADQRCRDLVLNGENILQFAGRSAGPRHGSPTDRQSAVP